MNSLIFPILRILADGQFHSGVALAQRFAVSRATVWQAIQQAQGLGVEVFSVRGRGYKLPAPLSLLDKSAVLAALGPTSVPFYLEIFDTLDSTNRYLMQRIAPSLQLEQTPVPQATCVVAELQTQGRGRRGRVWQSALGASLTFSLLWRFNVGAAALSGLSLAVGLALVRALRQCGLSQAALKWPNDIVLRQTESLTQSEQFAKLAGILIEVQGDMEGPSQAVIGVGLNLRLPEAIKQQIEQAVTDMYSALGDHYDSNQLLASILQHLDGVLHIFAQQGFAALRQEWLSYHAYQGRTVYLLMPDASYISGVVTGVADDGMLLVRTAAGEQRFSAGEISLRGQLK